MSRIAGRLLLAAPLFLFAGCGRSDTQTAPVTSVAALGSTSGDASGLSSATSGITGTVSSLAGACPAITFKLEGKVIKTAAATRFDGGACADVKNGSRVNVAGPTQTDASVSAEKVTILPATTTTTPPTTTPPTTTPTTPPATGTAVTITGTASAVEGTCPAVSLKLEGKVIKTSSATVYDGGACGDVKNGARFTISGTTQADASVLATKVAVLPPLTTTTTPTTPTTPPATPTTPTTSATVTITGTASAFEGTCPTIVFTLEGKRIRASAETTYENGVCGDVKNGARATATGTPSGETVVLAKKITLIK